MSEEKNYKKRSAAKAGLSYVIGNYCIKGIGIISAPVFARLLTTEDYGIYNTFIAYEGILYIIICLALHASLKNAYIKFGDRIDEYTSSISLIPILMLSASCVLVMVFHNFIANTTGMQFSMQLILLIYSYCSGVIILYRHRIALEYRSKEYLWMSFINVIGNFCISLFLVTLIFRQNKYWGRILGGVLPYLVLTAYILISLSKKGRFKYNREYWRYGLKISIPLIPHGLAQVFLLQFDRIMIRNMCGAIDAGIYSFSYTLYSLIQITGNSLSSAFEPWVFQKLKKKEYADIRRISTCYMLLLAGIATVGILFSPEIVILLGGKKYTMAVYSTIPILFAGFFAMTYSIPAVVEYYHEKTQYISIGTTLAAVINVVLNCICIEKYGYIAAAYTTLISYILYFALHAGISRKLGGFFIIDMRVFAAVLAILVIAVIVGLSYVESVVIRIMVSLILVSFGLLLIIHSFGFSNIMKILNRKNNQ